MEILTRLLPKVLSYFVTYYVTSEADTPILSPAQQTVIYITENVSSELTLAVWVIGVASVVGAVTAASFNCCYTGMGCMWSLGKWLFAVIVVCSRRLWACCRRVSRSLCQGCIPLCCWCYKRKRETATLGRALSRYSSDVLIEDTASSSSTAPSTVVVRGRAIKREFSDSI